MQRRAAFAVGDVDAGLVQDERREKMQLSVEDGQMQGSIAVDVRKIDVWAVDEKQRHQLKEKEPFENYL